MATDAIQSNMNTSSPGSQRGMVAKLAVFAIVAVIAVVEILVAWLYLPSANAGQQQAAIAINSEIEQIDLLEPATSPAASDLKEVDLGTYTVTTYQPATNIVLRIDFHLYGTVLAKDEAAFVSVMESTGNRVRDNVITNIRTVNLSDLNDAGLGLIKRRILETTNRLLGKPFLQSILFSEFTFTEQ